MLVIRQVVLKNAIRIRANVGMDDVRLTVGANANVFLNIVVARWRRNVFPSGPIVYGPSMTFMSERDVLRRTDRSVVELCRAVAIKAEMQLREGQDERCQDERNRAHKAQGGHCRVAPPVYPAKRQV
jgi:hypothetical protein